MQLKPVVRIAGRRARLGTVLSAALTAAPLWPALTRSRTGYLPYYDRHLRSRRYRRLVVIEIGVGGNESDQPGGSLRVWCYYFPRSTIIGVDVHPKTLTLGRRLSGSCAPTSRYLEDLQRVLAVAERAPDVVIDDGSHIGEHVCTTFEALFPRLSAGGVYVIEDLHTSYWPSYGGSRKPTSAHSGRTAA